MLSSRPLGSQTNLNNGHLPDIQERAPSSRQPTVRGGIRATDQISSKFRSSGHKEGLGNNNYKRGDFVVANVPDTSNAQKIPFIILRIHSIERTSQVQEIELIII